MSGTTRRSSDLARACSVIKSTVLPGTTEAMQKAHPRIIILNSPEFLTEANARRDVAKPMRNIIGVPSDSPRHRRAARLLLRILPRAPFEKIMRARDAELVKYGGNCLLYIKTLFINILYDAAEGLGGSFAEVAEAMAADARLGKSHWKAIFDGGRGAGGHCFIKDFAAFSSFYSRVVKDPAGRALLRAAEKKNIALLLGSGKDAELLRGVYGAKVRSKKK
ncbi:MAG: UDPglucose 6-dehydrogenase [Parcubacteria group bacterium Gr01-1014_72]|nr:MAG: UDPglucose 6-dehydrogenase [Parcubacteria group bacterium Gr01-1014_72]